MSSWKRLTNLGRGKVKEAVDGLGGALGTRDGADRLSEKRAMERALQQELEGEARRRGDDVPDPNDLAARAREVRERIEAAQGLRDEPSSSSSPRGAGGAAARPADAGPYEPPGPPEVLPDGSVKRTL